jgi:hypothetical protein
VPYLKFSRDKRGYENFYLIEPPSGRDHRGKARPRLLFWFRTPPSVKVGRVPFSDDVRKMIEAQNPDLRFDWARIMSTPIPPPDADQWRERRRAEKAARRASREAEAEAEVAVAEAEAQPVAVAEEPTSEPADVEAIEEAITGEHVELDAQSAETPAGMVAATSDSQAGQSHEHRRRRRRRRGRRGRHGVPDAAGQSSSATPEEITPAQQHTAEEPETPGSDEV